MNKLTNIDWLTMVLLIIGGLNWGLIGAFDFNLVNTILGAWPVVETIIYILVGLSAIYVAVVSTRLSRK